jgi:aspartate 1-decarboxylase
MKTFVSGKVHDVRVTDKHIRYVGSISLSRNLIAAAGMEPYEQVHVINLNNGNRWVTYILPVDEDGVFTLNGGGARLGEIGDVCVLITYAASEHFDGAKVVFCTAKNEIDHETTYP